MGGDREDGTSACGHEECLGPDELVTVADGVSVTPIGSAVSRPSEQPAIFRTYTCPVCLFEFVVIFKDANLRRHVAARLTCPRPPDERLIDYGGPLCTGSIVARLPPRYLVLPASPDDVDRPGGEGRSKPEAPIHR